MTEQECIAKMVAPGTKRVGKYRDGVIQIHVTRACDRACFNCTQGSNLGGKTSFITPVQFRQAILSLKGYFGVYGVFGGNPALHPQFAELCSIMREMVPYNQRGIWCNNPVTPEKCKEMRKTFNPSISNLNVHEDGEAYSLFRMYWPEARIVGLVEDSRHSPVHLAMKDVLNKVCINCDGLGFVHYDGPNGRPFKGDCLDCNGTGQVYDEPRAWELISNCDINQHWSAMIGVFRGQLRAWFCEVAGAQAMLHQDELDYPDLGIKILPNTIEGRPVSERLDPDRLNGHGEITTYIGKPWWQLPMQEFAPQVRKHCHECGVPLRGYGELANTPDDKGVEQTSQTHASIYKPKRKDRRVELVTVESQLGQRLEKVTKYIQNAGK